MIREYIKILKEERAAKGKPFDGIRVLEALSGTGLRSIRSLKEIENIKFLVANDMNAKAEELIRKNMEFNGVDKSKYKSKF